MAASTPDTVRVGVVVPCHDAAPWIAELLDSLAAQTRPADEIVVVDDGSRDGSADVVATWSARHPSTSVQLLREAHQGVAAAVRRGIATSTTELVCRVDADDVLEPMFLAELSDALLQHPAAGYSYCAMSMFGSAAGRYPVRAFDAAELVIGGNFVPASALMRRAAYDATGGVADLPAWEDWDLWLSFLDASWPGVFVDRELYRWRRHVRSRNTLTWRRRRWLRLRIWWRHRRLVARHLPSALPILLRRLLRPVRQQ